MTKNIGGSLLPSSDARILQPLGHYQVRPLPALDTHALFWKKIIVAMHPNGYSCRVLAERMASGCGGLAISQDATAHLMAQE